ncbi:sodium-dependent transporter [Endozoicomonas lisbonensis]|uniref:Transporter n=1 Tax=Endozoicomonas lisbonensis TaxID=3120522 RepID=A0ABV2SF80_9GAMM
MKREQWASRTGFILAAVGSAIGLGNIWRFPYMAYENGGGAFLIPYFVAMLTAGIPFMIMEFGLGHKMRGSAPKVFARLSAPTEVLGWFQVFIAAVIACYYVVIIGWGMSYFGLSVSQGWGADANAFFFGEYLRLGDHSPTSLGSLQWHIVVPLLLAWCVTFFAVFTGVRGGIERLGKVMIPVLFIMVVLFTLRVLTLPGAVDGLNWMFQPDFSKLSDPKVWSAAYGQIFFTLSVGFAIMLAYSSYLPEKSDINNNAFMTVFINCGFSLLAGVMIFSVLGYMAAQQGVGITEVVSAGVGLAFVTIPTAINMLPMPWLLGPVFFAALVVAGLSSHISIVEAVTSSVMDKLGWSRKKAASVMCGTGALISLAFATNGGLLLLDLVDYFMNNVALLGSCLVELVLVCWVFRKLPELQGHINGISEFTVGSWWTFCLRFMSVGILLVIVATNLVTAVTENYGGYATSDILLLGWGLMAVMLVLSTLLTQSRPLSSNFAAEA